MCTQSYFLNFQNLLHTIGLKPTGQKLYTAVVGAVQCAECFVHKTPSYIELHSTTVHQGRITYRRTPKFSWLFTTTPHLHSDIWGTGHIEFFVTLLKKSVVICNHGRFIHRGRNCWNCHRMLNWHTFSDIFDPVCFANVDEGTYQRKWQY